MRGRAALCLFALVACSEVASLQPELTRFEFATAEEAGRILSSLDEFVLQTTPFDRMIRMGTLRDPGRSEFRDFLGEQARAWSSGEVDRIAPILRGVERQLSHYGVILPSSVKLIRATDRVEDGAPHTRDGAIVLPGSAISTPEKIRHAVFHEIFHVVTRSDPSLRDELYARIGFYPCGTLQLPRTLSRRMITNPDAPESLHFIRIVFSGENLAGLPILVVRSDRRSDTLFSSFELRLLEVHPRNGSCVLDEESKQRSFDLSQVDHFFEQVGQNTNYVIHPEEILADNFALFMTQSPQMRDPRIPEELLRILSR